MLRPIDMHTGAAEACEISTSVRAYDHENGRRLRSDDVSDERSTRAAASPDGTPTAPGAARVRPS
jgi:hypothetical protein